MAKQNAELLVEIKFQYPSYVDLAISNGITIGDKVFNSVSSKDDAPTRSNNIVNNLEAKSWRF